MKLSLILMVWNTSHLMARTLQTLQKQAIKDWELIVVDDMSEDDVKATLEEHGEGLPYRYFRLEHAMGMRGNTVSINYGTRKARGEVMMWSTPEVMLPPDALQAAYNAAIEPNSPQWVTIPSHGLTSELQLEIDTVDWQSNIHNIKSLVESYPPDHWNSVWFYLNFYQRGDRTGRKKANFGNNQTVAVHRQTWQERIGSFPYFLDYGSDDSWIADERRRQNYEDVTLWGQEAYHQWHTTCQYWMAQGKAPYWNANGHTIDNLLGDPRVPAGGTRFIWDGGDASPLTQEQIDDVLRQRKMVEATGFRYKEQHAE